VLDGLSSGSVDIVVGTHALLTDDVRFRALGVIVIDEQHRFGVEQRAALRDKGRQRSDEAADPDLLVMTATPIRAPRQWSCSATWTARSWTRCRRADFRFRRTGRRNPGDRELLQRVRDEVVLGRRAYVICPLVEDSEKVEATSAVEERTRLALEELRGLAVGLLHGQMKGRRKKK